MKIVLIAGAAAVALGVLGGTAVSGLRVKGEVMEAVADSLAALPPLDEHASDAATSDDPVVDGAHTLETDTLEADTLEADTLEADTSEADTSEVTPPVVPAEPTVGPGSALAEAASLLEGARKVSKIFAQMKPEDAAAVLEYLSDEEIEAILQPMSDRNAAPILEAFPPERAAALSRILLRSGSSRS